jgi:hypothetical protein
MEELETSVSDSGPEGPLIFQKNLERARGFEPPTPTLARLCSTPELHPHPWSRMIVWEEGFASLAFRAVGQQCAPLWRRRR